MQKVLVTGGAGFIGSHACVCLAEAGYEFVILDNFSNAKPETIDALKQITRSDFPVHRVDLLNFDATRDVFSQYSFDAVIHFAGFKAVGESVAKPLEYYHNNLTGTLNLLNCMRDAGCHAIVFSSSATVYGPDNTAPYIETMPTSATNPYGWTKVMNEQILRDYAVSDNRFSVVNLRYFNPVGAHESGLIGEAPQGIPNNLTPYIAKVATGALPQLNVTGADYDTPDGTGVRDYLHVMDLAEGHIAALRYALEHTGSVDINLGTGQGTSVYQMIAAYEQACGKAIPYHVIARRPGDIATCYADTAKAKELLGWESKRTIEQMCADSWRFTERNV